MSDTSNQFKINTGEVNQNQETLPKFGLVLEHSSLNKARVDFFTNETFNGVEERLGGGSGVEGKVGIVDLHGESLREIEKGSGKSHIENTSKQPEPIKTPKRRKKQLPTEEASLSHEAAQPEEALLELDDIPLAILAKLKKARSKPKTTVKRRIKLISAEGECKVDGESQLVETSQNVASGLEASSIEIPIIQSKPNKTPKRRKKQLPTAEETFISEAAQSEEVVIDTIPLEIPAKFKKVRPKPKTTVSRRKKLISAEGEIKVDGESQPVETSQTIEPGLEASPIENPDESSKLNKAPKRRKSQLSPNEANLNLEAAQLEENLVKPNTVSNEALVTKKKVPSKTNKTVQRRKKPVSNTVESKVIGEGQPVEATLITEPGLETSSFENPDDQSKPNKAPKSQLSIEEATFNPEAPLPEATLIEPVTLSSETPSKSKKVRSKPNPTVTRRKKPTSTVSEIKPAGESQMVETSPITDSGFEASVIENPADQIKPKKTLKRRKKQHSSDETRSNPEASQSEETLLNPDSISNETLAESKKVCCKPRKTATRRKKPNSIGGLTKTLEEGQTIENSQATGSELEASSVQKVNEVPTPTGATKKRKERLDIGGETQSDTPRKRNNQTTIDAIARKTSLEIESHFEETLEKQAVIKYDSNSTETNLLVPEQARVSFCEQQPADQVEETLLETDTSETISNKARFRTPSESRGGALAPALTSKGKYLAPMLLGPLSYPNLSDLHPKHGFSKTTRAFDVYSTKLDEFFYQKLPRVLPTLHGLTPKQASIYPIQFPTESDIQIQLEERKFTLKAGESQTTTLGKIINTGLDLLAIDFCPDGTHLALAGQQPSSTCRLGEIQTGPGTIQIWNVHSKPTLVTTLCHNFGTIFSLRWLPGYSPALFKSKALGLLSCVGSDGKIHIIAVSIKSTFTKPLTVIRLSLPNAVLVCFEWSPASHPGRAVAGTSHGDLIGWDLNKSLSTILNTFSFVTVEPPVRYVCHLHLGLLFSARFTYDSLLGLGVVTSGTDGYVCVHSWSSPHDYIRLHNQKSPTSFLCTTNMPIERELASLYVDSSNCLRWANLTSCNTREKKRIVSLGQSIPLSLSCINHHNLILNGTLDGTVSVFPFYSNRKSLYPSLLPAVNLKWHEEESVLRINLKSRLPQIFPLESYPRTFTVNHCSYQPKVAFRCVAWNPIHSLLLSSNYPSNAPLANYDDLPFKDLENPFFMPEKAFEFAAATASGLVILIRLHPEADSG